MAAAPAPVGGSGTAHTGILVFSAVVTAAGLATEPRTASIAFAVAQTAIVASLILRALRERRGWRGAQFVVAVSLLLLFTVPCWLYALDPTLLDRGSPARATLIVNIALYGYALGLLVRAPTGPPQRGLLTARPAEPRTRGLTIWWLLGCGALATLLLRHGSPLEYLSHLDQSAALNLGAFHLVALAFTMRFSVLAWAAARWSRGEPMPWPVIALAAAGTALIALLGARLFLVVALADFLLLYALLRRPLRLRAVAPYVVIAGIVIVFGAGTVKRYQSYRTTHVQAPVGFVEYATTVAPGEFATAYANNYVDTVRLVATADELVPDRAAYEYARPLLELAVKPLPRPIRPTLERQRLLQETFTPNQDYAYAMPLIATALLAGGVLVVVLASVLIGWLVAVLEARLSRDGLSVAALCTLVVAVVSVPGILRSGVPAGVTLFLVDVVGMWVVARTGLRPAR